MSLSSEQQRMVLDAAVKLAFTQELSSISLEDLTKASGISAFDIVRHYHSKEKILAAVLERELELIAGSVPSPELRFPGETLKDELQVLAEKVKSLGQGKVFLVVTGQESPEAVDSRFHLPGAGIGILMLASLGLLLAGDIHEINSVKVLLASMINGVAAIKPITDPPCA